MLKLEIPGYGELILKYLVSDFTGTLSIDGKLYLEVKEKLNAISEILEIHILTADTFGKAKEELKDINAKVVILNPGNEAEQKAEYVKSLGAEHVAVLGNGQNDYKMFKKAKLSIAVILEEGCYIKTLENADIIVKSPIDALNLFLIPKRLIAVLRK